MAAIWCSPPHRRYSAAQRLRKRNPSPWVLAAAAAAVLRPAVPPPQTEKQTQLPLFRPKQRPVAKAMGRCFMLQQQKKGAAGEHEQPGGSPAAQPLTEHQAGKANRHQNAQLVDGATTLAGPSWSAR